MLILAFVFAHLLPLVYCDRLVLVQVVFRHGDRAPMGEFTSKEAEAYYFRGREHITNIHTYEI
ncbi:hypothetical protein OESDEN_08963 [Oesophagostomum dentatum]|uniref:Histidine acid phosphatase n=1 Tax=Oesophagostomum dentatum TaxID=61180 RepID=A0A0B1T5Y1_OESDE|nr:hypothetical protein OESDEN_08963 [Oesophagostomum dentatum]